MKYPVTVLFDVISRIIVFPKVKTGIDSMLSLFLPFRARAAVEVLSCKLKSYQKLLENGGFVRPSPDVVTGNSIRSRVSFPSSSLYLIFSVRLSTADMFSYNYPHIVFSLPMSVPLGFLDFSPFLLSYSFKNKRNELSISMDSANKLQCRHGRTARLRVSAPYQTSKDG